MVCEGKGGGRGHNHTNVCTVNTMVVPSTHSRVISIHVNLSWEKMKERERERKRCGLYETTNSVARWLYGQTYPHHYHSKLHDEMSVHVHVE